MQPLSEAFGQDVGIASPNLTQELSSSYRSVDLSRPKSDSNRNLPTHLSPAGDLTDPAQFDTISDLINMDAQFARLKAAKLMGSSRDSSNDNIEVIVARDVEQGMCAQFKRVESMNEKRSINEPRLIPVSSSTS